MCLQNSLTRSAPLNSEAQGRSGARFHTSYDKRYVIKTISSEDVAEMHNILKKYHQVEKTRLSLVDSKYLRNRISLKPFTETNTNHLEGPQDVQRYCLSLSFPEGACTRWDYIINTHAEFWYSSAPFLSTCITNWHTDLLHPQVKHFSPGGIASTLMMQFYNFRSTFWFWIGQ